MTDVTKCGECGAEIPPGAPAGMCPGCLLREGLSPALSSALFTPLPVEAMQGHLPQFEILDLIGRGGMGAVYRARQRSLDRMVAIKVLRVQAGLDPEFAERFAREARTLAGLSHPNIVAVHDFGETDDLFYLVMEFVEGRDLRRILEAGPYSPADALKIIIPVCDALQHAHDRGVVHRDIKPANIIVDKSGTAKIADFGLAKILSPDPGADSLTMSDRALGTPFYMAPEQRNPAATVDHRADIYAVGVLIYEMLTGELPTGNFRPLSSLANVRRELDRVVLRAMEPDPARRYRGIADMRTDIISAAKSFPDAPATGPAARSRTLRLAVLMLWSAILGSLLVSAVLLRRHRPPQDVTRFGEHYYRVFFENIGWHEARRKCESMGGYLAIVGSTEEDEFLAALSRGHVWIGATDEAGEGRWRWLDGSPLEYTNWDAGEPNNARDSKTGMNENYLMISKYGKWNDLAADSPVIHGFICEWDAGRHPGPFQVSSPEELHAALRKLNPGYESNADVEVNDGSITAVSILHTGISDISPLRGMGLKRLNLAWSGVTDLSPLRGMQLQTLELSRSLVSDLSPLAGMPLTELRLDGTGARDLNPLRGMKLTYLDISHTAVADLAPLKGMPLSELHMSCTAVTDLSPLSHMPLKKAGMLDAPVTDFSPLATCISLESLDVPPTAGNIECLRNLPDLKRLNGKPPVDFWSERNDNGK